MGKVEQAKIGELRVEEDQDALDELLSKVKIPDGQEYRIIDALLDKEIVDTMRGHFRPGVVYNMPFASDKGSVSCRECDLVDGGCWYKKNNVRHVHVVGVGYQGSLTAMRSYGMMTAYVEDRPEVVEETIQGAKVQCYAAYAEVTDKRNGNSIGRWYFQPVMMKAGKGFKVNEHAAGIAQSKALRNCILALIPHDLIDQWVEDYRSGKKPFDPARTKEMGYHTPTDQPTPSSRRRASGESKPKEQSGQLNKFIGDLVKSRGLNREVVDAWVQMRETNTAQDTLFVHRLVNDDAQWAEAEPDYRKFEQEFLKVQQDQKETEDFFEKGE